MLKYVFGLLWCFWASFCTANPLTPRASGGDTVRQTVEMVARIFNPTHLSDIRQFLQRIARVESDYGLHPATYRSGYYGGIWQVDRIAFAETQRVQNHPRLKRVQNDMRTAWVKEGLPDVPWRDLVWRNLTTPLYSAVAARLYLSLVPAAVPKSLEEQARYWKTYYNTAAGSGRVEDFVRVNQERR
jgi:hypothetical protein